MKITTTARQLKALSRLTGERLHFINTDSGMVLMGTGETWTFITQAPLEGEVTDAEDGWSVDREMFFRLIESFPSTKEDREHEVRLTTDSKKGLIVEHRRGPGNRWQRTTLTHNNSNPQVEPPVKMNDIAPQPIVFDDDAAVTLPESLRVDMRAALSCTDPVRPATEGIRVEVTNKDVTIAAADGIRLYESIVKQENTGSYSAHLSSEACHAILRFPFEQAHIDVESHNWKLDPEVGMEDEDAIYVAMAPLTTPHIDYQALVQQILTVGKGHYTKVYHVPGAEFARAVKTCRVFARSTYNKGMTIAIDGKNLRLLTGHTENGHATVEIELDKRVDDPNWVYLSALHLFSLTVPLKTEDVTMYIHHELPAFFKWGSRTAMIMQMKPPQEDDDEGADTDGATD